MRARSSPRPRSLAARLTLAVVCLSAVGLMTFGAAGTLLLERSLTEEVDNRLRTLPVLGRDGAPPPPGDRSEAPPFPTDLRSLTIGADGSVLDSVGQTGSDSSLPDTSVLDTEELRRRAGEAFDLPSTSGGSDWRVLTSPGEDGSVHLVAQSLAGVDGTLNRLLLIESVVGLAVVTALGFGAAAIVRLQLRPLREIEATAQAIAGGDLDRRVPAQEATTETGRVGAALNTMLARLSLALRERDRAAETTRRFVADASHELRTPLSSIRGFAELYRQGRSRGMDSEAAGADRWMSRIEGEAERMGNMVHDLLILSRFDEAPALERSDVELGRIAREVVLAARARVPGTAVELVAPSAVQAVGDGDRIRQVLENLVGNALAHTPRGTPVRVRVTRTGCPPPLGPAHAGSLPPGVSDVAVLTVSDEGPGIPPKELPHLFDRFYRGDQARAGAGSGLGLAISAAFVAAHDGYLTVESAPDRGSVFTVVLPLG